MTGHFAPTSRGYSEALPMSASYFSLILRERGHTPREQAALLDGTGVEANALGATGEITLGQQLRQLRNVTELAGPGWSLSTGAKMHAATHGPLGIGAVTAPSMRQSVEIMTRFSQWRAPHFRLHARVAGETLRLVPEDRVALAEDEQRALLDIVLLSTQSMIEAVLGRPMREGHFELPYAEPEDARGFRDYFHAAIRFGCPEAAIVIPVRWLNVESPFADSRMYEASLESLRAAARGLHGDRLLVARVEHLLAKRGARIQLRTAATVLGLSVRTLSRKLEAEGTSFHALLDVSLKSRAAALLSDPELTIAETAYALGYEDAANFGRAFRRWFGQSPARFRARKAASSQPE